MIGSLFIAVFGFLGIGQKPISSLLVPGTYQIHNSLKRGYVYLVAEGVLLSYYLYTHKEMTEIRTSYIEYAREHALGDVVQSEGILTLLEKYRSFNDYYESLYREARQIYPDEPAKQDEYVKENIKTSLKWNWDSEDDWYSYQDKRREFRELENRTIVIMGFLLTNHLSSLVDGIITHRILKNRAKLKTTLLPDGANIELSLSLN